MADIRVSEVKQMTPDRAALRDIAERLKTESAYPSPSPRWYEDVQQIADYVLALAAPLLVKCTTCGGTGEVCSEPIAVGVWIGRARDACPTCHGTGSVERASFAAMRKRLEAPGGPENVSAECRSLCGDIPFLLDLIAAQAREIERLKEAHV